MKYRKSRISINEQIALLTENKGFKCSNQSELERALVEVGHYKLSAYWFPCKPNASPGLPSFAKAQHSKPSSIRMNLTEPSGS